MADSMGNTICDILGIASNDCMSENELNWRLAIATRKPFLSDQSNTSDYWFNKHLTEDDDALAALDIANKKMIEKRRLENGADN